MCKTAIISINHILGYQMKKSLIDSKQLWQTQIFNLNSIVSYWAFKKVAL